MKTFNYKVQLYVKVWQEVELTVKAHSQKKADAMMIQLAKDQPLSLDNGNDNIEIMNTKYLCDTESLVDNTDKQTVEVYRNTCGGRILENVLYTNAKRSTKEL
jgi:hypothetical protein